MSDARPGTLPPDPGARRYVPEARPRSAGGALTDRTRVSLPIAVVVVVAAVLAGLIWRVGSQVQQMNDRLTLEERILRVVAKKVGVVALDLGPPDRDADAQDP